MSAFDDLIPGQGNGAGSAFADLIKNRPVEQDGPLTRGWNKMIQSVGITGALATGDEEAAAGKISEAARYQQANPGTPEGNELMAAWQRGDGISGGMREVGGEFAKDWREAPSTIKAIRATGSNLAAMGSGVVEQVPNMILPMSGMIAGGVAGSTVGPVGTVGGAWAGASTGNALVEGGGMAQEALHKAGINPLDTEAVKAYLAKNGDDLLLKAGIKGAVIGAVDTATMGIGTKLLTGPARAATGRALVDMGVDMTDKAAVQAAIKSPELAARVAADPLYKAATTGAQGVSRNVTAAALEPAGEFTGEYLGQGLATGEYDEKEAFLEAASSIGQSGATFAGQKAYAALKYPFKAGNGSDAPAGAPTVQAADDVPGTPELPQAAPTEAEKALAEFKPITALDRVVEIDRALPNATPEEVATLAGERERITASWPKVVPGLATSFSTETGVRLDGRYALMDADELTTSHDEGLRPVAAYPAELQPRERERHASEMQIGQIVQKLDPARLGESADVATGAPIVGADGLVESGNARTIALKRAYRANGQKAADYKQFLTDNAARFGLAPEDIAGMGKPVLVRVRETPVNRAEFARQANQATVARMSPSEQARSDAAQIDSLEDLNPTETGEFSSGASAPFVRRFMTKLPATEQAGLIDAAGQLSQAGYQRIRNAVLAKAYGDSPVLQRMVESLDSNVRNVGAALLRVAPQVAKTREAIDAGALHEADITPDLLMAVEELSAIKEKGTSVREALAQSGMFGDKLTPEARELLDFLDANIRSPRRIAEFVQNYIDALEAAGNPNQGSLLGDATAPAKGDLLSAAKRGQDGITEDRGQPEAVARTGEESGQQPENAPGDSRSAQNDEAARRELIEKQWNEALGDLGAIVRDYAPVARMVPEDTPNLMPTLVKLFEAGFGKVGYVAKDLIAYVKAELKRLPEFKSTWNKIAPETYRKAAASALANHQAAPQGDLFSAMVKEQQADLFSGQTAANFGAAKTERMVIDGNEYDLDAPNFGMASPPITLKDGDPLLIETNTKPADSMVGFNGEKMTRAQMRQILEDSYFRNAAPAPEDRKPIAYVMGGGGASGKGTIKKYLRKEGVIQSAEAVDIDPDELKLDIPEFNAIKDAGDSRGAATVHEESSGMARRIKERAMGGRYDIILDVTLGDPKKGAKYLQDLKDAGYEVRLYGVSVQPETAVIRAMKRAEHSWRYVPISALLSAHKGFVSAFEQYAKIADEARLYENTTDHHNVAEKSNGILEVKDDQAYNEIVERSLINESAETLREIRGPRQRAGRNHGEDGRQEGSPGRPGADGDHRGRNDDAQVETQGNRSGSRPEKSGSLVNESDRNDGAPGAQGEVSVASRGTGRKRTTQWIREGEGGNDLFADNEFGAPDSGQLRVQQDGRSDGAPADNERRAAAGARDRSGRATGIPAGRDIPAKSGRNYRFGDGDLTYDGGWQKKAAQNVEAIELAKKLETEGRQATREEQAILAKFIGWGASEIRNSIFGDKLDKAARSINDWKDAKAAMDEAGGSLDAYHRSYYPAYILASQADPSIRYRATITAAMLDKAKPDMSAAKWIDLRDRLKAALTEEEWATAERSTQYAHYTSKAVVQSMWKAVERMGFKGGAILEPGAGIGVFPGLMDSALATNSVYTGIEYDALTGAILKLLFPDERILVESFVGSSLPDNFYDMAIGNPPFANVKVLADPKYKKNAFSLHDYFFAKSIDKVKPGGLMVYVTSRYTMDKHGDKARKYLADRADLIGAIRLPQTAFQKNAGTEVVTDVLFLRKRVAGDVVEKGATNDRMYLRDGAGNRLMEVSPWLGVQEVQTDKGPALINEYFAAHPEMVLGAHSLAGSMYSKNEYTVLPNKDSDIEAQFAAAIENLPADIYRPTGAAAEAAKVREIDFNPKAQKEGNYYLSDAGVLMQREGGVGVRADEGKSEKTVSMLKDFVKLRDALKQAHYDQLNDGDWAASLKALQKEYRAFVMRHGNILQNRAFERTVKREDEETGQVIEDVMVTRRFDLLNKINDDPDYTLVEALEKLNEETGEIAESAFLRERVLAKPSESRIETPHDALLSVLNDTGAVDLPLIAERLGISESEAAAALGTAIYESPSEGWQMADAYLSGNVKQKLSEAQEAAKADRRFERNVEALLSAQPAPVPPSDITAAIGMNWIPASAYAQFLQDKTGVRATVDYNERTGQWTVTAHAGYGTPAATVDWGTVDRNAADILDHALTGRPIRVTRTEGTGSDRKQVFDPAATEAANQKLAQMRGAFAEWLWQDGERADTLTRAYNDKFNTIVARKFDGRHLTLPGSTTIKVFDHVKRGAWRIIQAGNTYLAHAVGSGKTWQMVISAMEQKRLGLIQKPMMVVPNHMLQQFAREWLQLYPAARLMVADEKQFHTENRRRFVARVAMSDLDGVIITHSAFKLLDLDPEFKHGMIEEQLDYLRAALEEAGGEEGKKSRDPKVRDIQNRIEKMEQKLEAAMSSSGKDKNVRFDQLGVDMLYVDEAHEFRKLAFTTQRQVKGIDSSGSDRAFDLWMKTRWLEQKKPGRSLVMASGTPVTNTLAELYSVQKFMAPQVLEDRGLQDFDSWAAMFGQENTEIEADASGKYAPVTRFTKFVNVPELTQMFREYADVLTSDHLAEMLGDKRPKVKDGSRKLNITPQTDDYTAYKAELASRLGASRRWKPSKDEPNNPDPIIKIIGDGRLAAIDMRFVDPSLPSDPDSKLNQMIDGVIEVFKRTAGNEYIGKDGKPESAKGGAQMVFSDLGFGAGVAANRGFNARSWFEKRLRDAGIPMNQVSFMSDHKKSSAKLKLFQDVNAGRVRILVGSSKNMGTGVNAQQRLVALHHLDTPWYPADLEQREGRIIRQGNKNPLVEIYAYSTKGSYDTVMWQMLASKQRFIDQALSGDSSVRSIDDLTEASQFQIATAMTAGDPRAIQLAGLKADIDKYHRLYCAHEETRSRLRREYDLAGSWIEAAERQTPDAEKQAARVRNLSGENFTAKAGGKTFDKRKDWGEALLATLKDYAARGKDGRHNVGEISGFPVEFVGQIVRDAAGNIKEYRTGLWTQSGEENYALAHNPSEDPVGMVMRATNLLASISRKPAELRQRIDDSKAKRGALVDRLDAKFQFAGELADKLKEAEALEAAMVADQGKLGEPKADEPKLSRGAGRGMSLRDLQAVVDRLTLGFKNLPRVHVMESPADLSTKDPSQKALRDYIKSRDAMDDADGAMHDGEIYLFASGMAGELRAEHVLATHEITHYGLRGAIGKELDAALQHVWLHNGKVRKAAQELRRADETIKSNVEAVEEVLADMPSADLAKLIGWRKMVKTIRNWLKKVGAERMAARLDKWLAAGLDEQHQADLFVADLVTAAREWVRTGKGQAVMTGTRLADPTLADDMARQEKWLHQEAAARGYKTIDDLAEKNYPLFEKLAVMWRKKNPVEEALLSRAPRLSRASTQGQQTAQTVAEHADSIIQSMAATPRPVDGAIKVAVQASGFDKLTTAIYNKAAFFLDRHTPETIKAGIVADYGIPEAVIDQRAAMQGRMRGQLRKTGELIEKLSMLTREESRVAYAWMNNADTQAAAHLEQQLPPDSVKAMGEVKQLIDQLSREAVRLGQLDPATYEKNRYEYLRRTYAKHVAEQTTGEKKGRQRAIAILGDQYKGRGMTDAVDMAKIKAAAPEWWGRKLQAGKADKGLKGERFIRLERRAPSGEGTAPMDGMGDRQRGRLQEVAYWPAGELVPAKYAAWDQAGAWEARDTKGGKLVMWRDFTKQERETMGEIDEARFAIARTMQGMIHDVEVGRFLEWLAVRYAKKEGERIDGQIVEASERMRDTFKPGEWVQIPDTKIPGTQVKKYGILSGRYLPGPIWNDVRQVAGGRYKPFGETYAAILSAWKTAKTALSPAVHMNNVMANIVMADWHDVTAGHIHKALNILLAANDGKLGLRDKEAATEILNRYRDSGGGIGTWITQELQREQLEPLMQALEAEIAQAGNSPGAQIAAGAIIEHLKAKDIGAAWATLKQSASSSKAGKATVWTARKMIDMYEAEDQVFRLAAWLKAKEEGAADLAAGKASRKSFLDYHINAPWIQMMRQTALPFIAFTYRALPMFIETAAKKPWKLMKLAGMIGALNAIGYALSGGDEDDERRFLPEEKAGTIYGLPGIQKLVRMPWNDIHSQPVFLDIRRFVPVGDVFDLGQTHSALPMLPFAVPGGPLALLGELVANKSQFTGRAITLETDTPAEKAEKVFDHIYKAFAPNIVVLPGTYAFTGAMNASTGKTDAFGRELSPTQAMLSSIGIKVGSYPQDVLKLNAQRSAQAKLSEIDRNITALKRERMRNGIDDAEFREKVSAQQAKQKKLVDELRAK